METTTEKENNVEGKNKIYTQGMNKYSYILYFMLMLLGG